jgi:hypothetical protein
MDAGVAENAINGDLLAAVLRLVASGTYISWLIGSGVGSQSCCPGAAATWCAEILPTSCVRIPADLVQSLRRY